MKRFLLMLCLILPSIVLAAPAQQDTLDLFLQLKQPWKGDFDGMVKRRYIRVAVVHNPMMYFLDNGVQRGATYDGLMLFEQKINKKLKTKYADKVHIVFFPLPRDQLLPSLAKGHVDIAAANLTVTDVRKKSVDFSNPIVKNVSELVVTGPKSPMIKSIDDLSGKEVFVRRSSSYHESLKRLDAKFRKAGKPALKFTYMDEYLEDADLLEMLNAGLISLVIVDSHKAAFWKDVFTKIKVHNNLTVNTGGNIALAFRKNSPKLKQELNAFVKANRQGTMMGNIILKRYLKTNKWVKSAGGKQERKNFESMVGLFRKYGEQYGIDYLKLAAQGFQESGLKQSVRSSAGAVGVMQLLPTTASDKNVGISNIDELEPNIHAGAKYLRFLHDRYFNDPKVDEFNRILFSLAAYNAGPARVAGLRKEARKRGLDPNKWFGNVEVIAANRIGRETVQYVANITKYYIAYSLIVQKQAKTIAAKKAFKK